MDDKEFDIEKMMKEDKEKGIVYDEETMKLEEDIIEMQKALEALGLMIVRKKSVEEIKEAIELMRKNSEAMKVLALFGFAAFGYAGFKIGQCFPLKLK